MERPYLKKYDLWFFLTYMISSTIGGGLLLLLSAELRGIEIDAEWHWLEVIWQDKTWILSSVIIAIFSGGVVVSLLQVLLLARLARSAPTHDENETTLLAAPKHARLHALEASWWTERGVWQRANDEYERALRLGLDDPIALLEYASFAHRKGDLNEAERVYRQVLSALPNLHRAHYLLACLLDDRKLYGEAEMAYRKSIEIHPDKAGYHHDLATLLSKLGRMDEAKAEIQMAVSLGYGDIKNMPRYLNSLGAILGNEGKMEEAIPYWQEARHLGFQLYLMTGEISAGVKEATGNLGMAQGAKVREERPERFG